MFPFIYLGSDESKKIVEIIEEEEKSGILLSDEELRKKLITFVEFTHYSLDGLTRKYREIRSVYYMVKNTKTY